MCCRVEQIRWHFPWLTVVRGCQWLCCFLAVACNGEDGGSLSRVAAVARVDCEGVLPGPDYDVQAPPDAQVRVAILLRRSEGESGAGLRLTTPSLPPGFSAVLDEASLQELPGHLRVELIVAIPPAAIGDIPLDLQLSGAGWPSTAVQVRLRVQELLISSIRMDAAGRGTILPLPGIEAVTAGYTLALGTHASSELNLTLANQREDAIRSLQLEVEHGPGLEVEQIPTTFMPEQRVELGNPGLLVLPSSPEHVEGRHGQPTTSFHLRVTPVGQEPRIETLKLRFRYLREDGSEGRTEELLPLGLTRIEQAPEAAQPWRSCELTLTVELPGQVRTVVTGKWCDPAGEIPALRPPWSDPGEAGAELNEVLARLLTTATLQPEAPELGLAGRFNPGPYLHAAAWGASLGQVLGAALGTQLGRLAGRRCYFGRLETLDDDLRAIAMLEEALTRQTVTLFQPSASGAGIIQPAVNEQGAPRLELVASPLPEPWFAPKASGAPEAPLAMRLVAATDGQGQLRTEPVGPVQALPLVLEYQLEQPLDEPSLLALTLSNGVDLQQIQTQAQGQTVTFVVHTLPPGRSRFQTSRLAPSPLPGPGGWIEAGAGLAAAEPHSTADLLVDEHWAELQQGRGVTLVHEEGTFVAAGPGTAHRLAITPASSPPSGPTYRLSRLEFDQAADTTLVSLVVDPELAAQQLEALIGVVTYAEPDQPPPSQADDPTRLPLDLVLVPLAGVAGGTEDLSRVTVTLPGAVGHRFKTLWVIQFEAQRSGQLTPDSQVQVPLPGVRSEELAWEEAQRWTDGSVTRSGWRWEGAGVQPAALTALTKATGPAASARLGTRGFGLEPVTTIVVIGLIADIVSLTSAAIAAYTIASATSLEIKAATIPQDGVFVSCGERFVYHISGEFSRSWWQREFDNIDLLMAAENGDSVAFEWILRVSFSMDGKTIGQIDPFTFLDEGKPNQKDYLRSGSQVFQLQFLIDRVCGQGPSDTKLITAKHELQLRRKAWHKKTFSDDLTLVQDETPFNASGDINMFVYSPLSRHQPGRIDQSYHSGLRSSQQGGDLLHHPAANHFECLMTLDHPQRGPGLQSDTGIPEAIFNWVPLHSDELMMLRTDKNSMKNPKYGDSYRLEWDIAHAEPIHLSTSQEPLFLEYRGCDNLNSNDIDLNEPYPGVLQVQGVTCARRWYCALPGVRSEYYCSGSCGDMVIQREVGEQCDPPDNNSRHCQPDQFCSATCSCLPRCGNGKLDEGEQCDDASSINQCKPEEACKNCKCQARCGDGRLDPNEECDWSVPNNFSQCKDHLGLSLDNFQHDSTTWSGCSKGMTQNFPYAACTCVPRCGNGKLDHGEECDPLIPLNPIGGNPCHLDQSCHTRKCECIPKCGNGWLDPGEECGEPFAKGCKDPETCHQCRCGRHQFLQRGERCDKSLPCASGFCVDGVCCDTACDGSCQTCAGAVPGQCSEVIGREDEDTCRGDQICDPFGRCLLGEAQRCAIDLDCASSFCVDGVCCDSACDGSCLTCAGAEPGRCTEVVGREDEDTCRGDQRCDPLGRCLLVDAQPCAIDLDCASGHCVDEVCCESACERPCLSCNAELPGVCTVVRDQEDDGCRPGFRCDEAGECRLTEGQSCASERDCASGHCVDQLCCDQACDQPCQECHDVEPGTCTIIRFRNDPDCGRGRACNAEGQCRLAPGQRCEIGADCASGVCLDGRCCDFNCQEQ